MERWQVDSTLDAVADIYEDFAKSFFGGSQSIKDAALEHLMRVRLPAFLNAMNERLRDKRYINGGHEPTIADFALGSLLLQTICNEYNPYNEQFMAEF